MAKPRATLTSSIGMKLALIQKGSFQMGSPPEEGTRGDDEPQHGVTITRSYYLGIYPVTQSQYERVMGENPSCFRADTIGGDSLRHPAERVSWEDAVEYCKRLSALPEEHSAGRLYRLPTEAEWEYACRAKTTGAYYFGDDESSLGEYAWYSNNSDHETHPVGGKRPNAWGLYDMHGNVWEWCSDFYGPYPFMAETDPAGPSVGRFHVLRGGSWINEGADCRSAIRTWGVPSIRDDYLGFRVALSSSGSPGNSE